MGIFGTKKFKTFPRSGKLDFYPSPEESDFTKIRKSDSPRKLLSMIKNVQTLESDSTQLKYLESDSLFIIPNVLLGCAKTTI